MNYVIVEDKKMMYAETIHEMFECANCALNLDGKPGCVRIKPNGDLFFETAEDQVGRLFCIDTPQDIVFINDTPEDIARYVAARLEDT